MKHKYTVSIVGLGYVGAPVALLVAKKGHSVTGIDLDQEKVDALNNGQDPIGEEYIAENLKDTSLTCITNFKSIKDSDFILICVPTPVKNDIEPDLSILEKACRSVGQKIKKGAVVVVESTINPGVCDEIVIPALESASGLKINEDFFVSHCPERINPGDKKWNVENIPRVVGSSNTEGLDKTVAFYRSTIDAEVRPMDSLKEAEAVKIVENTFRDVNIAFVNELAMSFSKLGIDATNVINGAATKPFAFMAHYPSIGVGGHCIPVDPYYLIEHAKSHGFEHEFLILARKINNRMPSFGVAQLEEGLLEVGISLKSATIAVLGLSYKPNVGDDRESPSYKVIDALKSKGADVTVYDPFFLEASTHKSLEETVADADGIILATSHTEFQQLPELKLKAKVLVDGKNAFDRSVFEVKGIAYKGIGR